MRCVTSCFTRASILLMPPSPVYGEGVFSLALSGGERAKTVPLGKVAPHWGQDLNVRVRQARLAFPGVPPGLAMVRGPALLPAAATMARTESSAMADPAVPRWGRRMRRGWRRRRQRRLHNCYSIRMGRQFGAPETYLYGERCRRGSCRRGLRTLSPAGRRPASSKSSNETDSCAVPLSQIIPEREQMMGVVADANEPQLSAKQSCASKGNAASKLEAKKGPRRIAS